MAIGKKEKTRQKPMWIPHTKVATTPGHPFYKTFNKILDKERFDEWLEGLCEPYFRRGGRPSIPPGVYFRMLMIGYCEGSICAVAKKSISAAWSMYSPMISRY